MRVQHTAQFRVAIVLSEKVLYFDHACHQFQNSLLLLLSRLSDQLVL